MRRFILLALPIFFFVLLFPAPVAAESVGDQYDKIQSQGIIYANICEAGVENCACRDEGRCTLDDMLQLVANVMVFILAISGSLVLVLFVYGGIVWITSNGRPEKVQNGKMTMVRAVVGLIIVFGSYALVSLLISVLLTGNVPDGDQTLEEIIGNGAEDVIETSTD
jgi:hypothetical protein